MALIPFLMLVCLVDAVVVAGDNAENRRLLTIDVDDKGTRDFSLSTSSSVGQNVHDESSSSIRALQTTSTTEDLDVTDLMNTQPSTIEQICFSEFLHSPVQLEGGSTSGLCFCNGTKESGYSMVCAFKQICSRQNQVCADIRREKYWTGRLEPLTASTCAHYTIVNPRDRVSDECVRVDFQGLVPFDIIPVEANDTGAINGNQTLADANGNNNATVGINGTIPDTNASTPLNGTSNSNETVADFNSTIPDTNSSTLLNGTNSSETSTVFNGTIADTNRSTVLNGTNETSADLNATITGANNTSPLNGTINNDTLVGTIPNATPADIIGNITNVTGSIPLNATNDSNATMGDITSSNETLTDIISGNMTFINDTNSSTQINGTDNSNATITTNATTPPNETIPHDEALPPITGWFDVRPVCHATVNNRSCSSCSVCNGTTTPEIVQVDCSNIEVDAEDALYLVGSKIGLLTRNDICMNVWDFVQFDQSSAIIKSPRYISMTTACLTWLLLRWW